MTKPHIIIIGAGPAGLTAAYQLSKADITSDILEKSDIVGGIAQTTQYKGYRFDIGGHRFFTKVKEVENLWHEIMSDDFLTRSRLSRIFYKKKFFHYPLKPWNAFFGLGPWETLRVLISLFRMRLSPHKTEENFENWVENRFGKRLFAIFFKSYTEKVWGVPCTEIKSEWAAQRIKKLSLMGAIINAFFKSGSHTSLIDSFQYPKLGPGQLWERCAHIVSERGHGLHFHHDVTEIRWQQNQITSVITQNQSGVSQTFVGTHFISSMPLVELITKMNPLPPPEVVAAATRLRYRDFLTVALVINKKEMFPDNWIYIHDPSVLMGRIQNFKNWSPYMVVDDNKTCLGLEYFAFVGDNLWSLTDEELVALGKKEICQIGLATPQEIEDGTVIRMPKAYPMYTGSFREDMDCLRTFLSSFKNLFCCGRNGQHRYNNQDHSMMTAILTVKNILGENHNIWDVNVEDEYHEEKSST